MSRLPEEILAKLKAIFDDVDFEHSEVQTHLDEFEKELMRRFTAKTMQKLPEQERAGVAQLANAAAEGKQEEDLKKKLAYWLNEKEVEEMWTKVTQDLLTELARNLYSGATAEQKKKLEAWFKPGVLQV